MSEDGGFHVFGEGEMPQELEHFLQSITRRMFDSGMAHDPAEDFMPSEIQKAIEPGDKVGVTSSKEHDEFTVAEVLDPELHEETFPDWRERVEINSYVCVKAYKKSEPTGFLGWLPRTRLIKVTEDQFAQMLRWVRGEDEQKQPPPEWLTKLYNETLAAMAIANPEDMATPIKCPDCGSVAVVVAIEHHHTNKYCMGNKPGEADQGHEAKALYVVSPYQEDHNTTSYLDCLDCFYHLDLPDEQELLRDWRV